MRRITVAINFQLRPTWCHSVIDVLSVSCARAIPCLCEALANASKHHDLIARALPAVLVTLMPDGRPQASVVWVAFDDGQLSLNTEAGRQKVRNMTTDPRVAVLIVDPDDQHRYLELRCDVTGFRSDGALEHRAELDRQYLGPDHWTDPAADGGDRVIIDLTPVRINAYG